MSGGGGGWLADYLARPDATATRKVVPPGQPTIGPAVPLGAPIETGARGWLDALGESETLGLKHAIEHLRTKGFTAGDVSDASGVSGVAAGLRDNDAGKLLGGLGAMGSLFLPGGPGASKIPAAGERFGIVTAENAAGHTMPAEINAARNASLEADLHQMGRSDFAKTIGRYKDSKTGEVLTENGYYVPGLSEREAKLLGARYGQNAVITQDGYHDLKDGLTYPSRGVGPTNDLPYTQLPDGQKFALDIDWDKGEKPLVNKLPVPKNANPEIMQAADQFNNGTKLPRVDVIDTARARMMAKVYDGLPVNDPAAKPAYDALNAKVAEQFQHAKNMGYSFDFVKDNPYKNSAEMMKDVRENRHLSVFATPADNFHPYMTPEQNDQLRAVHDWIAHAGPGNGFGPVGEENAYRVHASTMSPLAQRALATETRGQNSWVNFGPHGLLPVTERPFAQQKAALWPEGLLGDYKDMPEPRIGAPSVITKPTSGDVFDTSKLGTDIPAGVTTERPPVQYPTDRTDQSSMSGMTRKFREIYTPNAERALKDNPKSAGWYDMSQVRDAMSDLSPSGAEDFKQFMLFMGPTSIGTQTPANLRQASKMYQLWKNGQLNPDVLKSGTLDLPAGYTNRRQGAVNSGITRVLDNGNLDPLATPKTFRYANQLAGHAWGGAALDMHVGRQVGENGLLYDSGKKDWVEGRGFPTSGYDPAAGNSAVTSSPKPNVYPVIEDKLIREAGKLGLTPTQYQAAGWAGGAEKTKVADPRTMLELVNEKLRTTAKKYGYSSPLEAWYAFNKGETPFWGLLGGAGVGGGLLGDEKKQKP